jgi:hypothetical protein
MISFKVLIGNNFNKFFQIKFLKLLRDLKHSVVLAIIGKRVKNYKINPTTKSPKSNSSIHLYI